MLKDPDLRVQMAAAGALGEIRDPRSTETLTSALKAENLVIVLGACRFFVRRGEAGTEAILIRALDGYGTQETAMVFHGSGNAQLWTAARAWASCRGYAIEYVVGRTGRGDPRWGVDK